MNTRPETVRHMSNLAKMAAFVYSLVAVIIIACSVNNVLTDQCVDDESRVVTDALKEKWGITFDYGDVDNDGIYSVDDEFAFGQSLSDLYDATGEMAEGFKQYGLTFKEAVEGYYGVDTTKTALTRPEYVSAYSWYWTHHNDLFKQRLRRFVTSIFHGADSDDDGEISFDEFEHAYNIYGDPNGTQHKAKSAFKLYDTNGDEVIEEQEFIDYNLAYFTDPDVTAKELPLV